jgi:ubiquinone/menaquinone biosynthesis C-methylase UbiE
MAGSKLYRGVAVADPYYSSGADLKAKNELAAREGPDVPGWALAHIDLTSLTTALDVGAGWGRFDRPLLEWAESLRYLVCADISPGMLGTCRLTLADARPPALFVACDARLLPFPLTSFEMVMANHMLYELAEPAVAAVELARVLKREGTLVATTYSDQVRVHLVEFHRAALVELGLHRPAEPPASFSLENGGRVLGQAFHHVEVDTLEDVRRLGPRAAHRGLPA